MSIWTEIVGRGVLAWIKNRPFSQESRDRRKAKRRAKKKLRRGETLTEDEVLILSTKEGGMFPKGTQTLTGIAVLMIGPWAAQAGFSNDDVTTWVAAVATVVGGIVSVLGYLRRKKMPAE